MRTRRTNPRDKCTWIETDVHEFEEQLLCCCIAFAKEETNLEDVARELAIPFFSGSYTAGGVISEIMVTFTRLVI